ncbi:hypothetical protein OEZ85_003805 [Tetradesmus obliquus]|uniref:ubiquitinyl hydrolase 1 n=1 Tax=Tetradesmus obliquus TaxID=3088 RepID=A0ABY8UDN2_TETOB|nr:hypothetical protein OEZ85_003805 [Tetradesmus obliquus]
MIHLVGAGIGVLIIVVFIYASIAGLWRDSQDLRQHVFAARTSLDGEPWWERSAIARRMSIDAGLCRVCSKPTTTHCSRCKSVKYCSIACQRKDWGSNHKFECDNLQKQAAAQTAAAALGSSSGHPASNGSLSKPPPLDPNEDAPVPRQVLFSYQHYLQLCHNRTSCRRPPIGLTNHGNNCYANSALQCLLASRPLRAYLDQGLHSRDCNKPGNEWCLLCQLQVLCKRMAEAPVGSEVSVRPLLSHLRRFAKTLSLGRQEDAHEFFYSLLNTLEAIQLTNYGGKERFDMRTQETTLVHHVFGGYLRSQVVCGGCGAASRRYEACLDLQLEVPGGVDRLEDALARHTAEEVLDGDNRYACDGCGRRCRACRSTRFEVAPNSLVLCLKRFGTGRFGKINKVLVYGEALDLSPFMAQQAMDEGPVTYTLSGVIVHLDQMNSTSFGHYICFVRTADGRWYICDDARVAPTSPSRVLSQNAYMLFYTLCGCSLVHAVRLATDKETIATAMTADKTFPQLSQEIRYVNLFATEMAKYVDAADSDCTMFAPDNTAIQKTMTGLGSYVGLFLQNQTMQELVLNHHVIPGSIVKAAGFGDGSKAVPYTTRANQTIWLLQRNGQPYVAFGEKYVVPVQIADIPNKRNKCVLHIIDEQTLIPPSLLSTFEDWQQKAGKPGSLNSPKSAWLLPASVTRMQSALLLAVLLAGFAGCSSAAAPAAPSVMALADKYTNISQGLSLINATNEDLAAYLSNPKTVCTFFAPSDSAMTESISRLGKYAGIAAQNDSLQSATFNYHVIPGKALTSADLMKLDSLNTRAKETLWVLHRKGAPKVYSRPDYPVPLEGADIKAGGCIVHIMNTALVPPSAIPMVNEWLIENKALPPPGPRSEWGKVQVPMHQDMIDLQEKGVGLELPANATAATAAAAAATAKAAPAAEATAAAAAPSSAAPPAAAKSAAGGSRGAVGFAGAAVAVAAAVALWA